MSAGGPDLPPGSPLPHVERLVALMARLRGPEGCPWDREQTARTLRTYVLEECYEVLEAIDRGRTDDLVEELGDLLLQVVFLAQVHAERGEFTLDDVARRISEKLVRRHPHVFGKQEAGSSEEALARWEAIKRAEKKETAPEGGDSVLDGVPAALPALAAASRLTAKAARVGFDWERAADVLAKVAEESAELESALAAGKAERAREEVGDLLFVVANLARKLEVDPEQALRDANRKFRRRFRHIEDRLAQQGRDPSAATLSEMDALWREAKEREGAEEE